MAPFVWPLVLAAENTAHRTLGARCSTGKGRVMDSFFKLIAAGPLFFVSAWLLMLFAGMTHTDIGIAPFGYLTAMVVTIGLWLTVAPAIGAASRARPKKRS